MYRYVLVLFAIIFSSCSHIEIEIGNTNPSTLCSIEATKAFFITVPIQDCMQKDAWIVEGNSLYNKEEMQKPLLSFFYKQGTESNEEVLKRLFIKENLTCSLRTLRTTPNNTRLQITGSGTSISNCGTFSSTPLTEESYFEFQEGKERFFFKHPVRNSALDMEHIRIEK